MEKDFDNIEEVEALQTSGQDDLLETQAVDSEVNELDAHLEQEAVATVVNEQISEASDNADVTELEASIDETIASEDGELDESELASFESAEIEDEEFVEDDRIMSIVESVLFATDKPQTLNTIKQAFQGTMVKTKHVKRAIENLMIDYASAQRGFSIEEVSGGYQLRTKVDNMEFLKRMLKPKAFKLSGPALEVLSIVAYKQPCIKMNIDEIRGVESGHLLRALMEKGLVNFAGKSEFPGKPMLYQTTRKFLEVFGLRNINELPSLSEIDELIPEGIGEEEEEKPQLNDITDELSNDAGQSYSEHEEELEKITDKLSEISTSSDFFEQEKVRQKQKRDAERAQDIEDKLALDEDVENKDLKWLERYKKAQEELLLEKQKEEEIKASQDEHITDEVQNSNNEEEPLTENKTDSELIEASADDANVPDSSEEEVVQAVEVTNNNDEDEDDLISALERAIESDTQSGDEVKNLMNEDSKEKESEEDSDLNL